jgi:4'-phosphopantetheinyl transferase EntD
VIVTTPHAPWQTAFLVALPHGLCAGVHLPVTPDPVPAGALARLLPGERDAALGLRGFRQVEFVGGRIAFSLLFSELGLGRCAVGTDPHGAPVLPPAVVGSISHKRDLVVALLARGAGFVGIDLEDTQRAREGVARRVLTPAEFQAVEELPAERRWTETAVRFAVKEAIYKALHPVARRYIGFGEAEVWPGVGGLDRVTHAVGEANGWTLEARHTWVGTRVLATVRARAAA